MGKKAKQEAKASAKEKSTEKAAANPRLVAAIRAADTAKDEYKSKLIDLATICQEEQCTRSEIVASYMEAKGVVKATAESQYSRMKKLLSDPETLRALKSGEIDLKTAREKTAKKQKAPSADKKKENNDKKFTRAVNAIVEVAKESGMDRESVISAIKSALKKGGVK